MFELAVFIWLILVGGWKAFLQVSMSFLLCFCRSLSFSFLCFLNVANNGGTPLGDKVRNQRKAKGKKDHTLFDCGRLPLHDLRRN